MKKSRRSHAELRPRFRVVYGKSIALGPGKVELLSALEKTGSLNEAARALGMSYMRAWTLVQTMNKCFARPVAMAERGGKKGGGMALTKTGRLALQLYSRMEERTLTAVEPEWTRLRNLLNG